MQFFLLGKLIAGARGYLPITALAAGIGGYVEESGLVCHQLVATIVAREVVDAIELVEGTNYVCSLNDAVASETFAPELRVVMFLAICRPFDLKMSLAIKWPLAGCTNKMLDVPAFAEGCHDPFFDWASTGPADCDFRLVVASETIQVALKLPCIMS